MEFSYDTFGDKPLQQGREMALIDPFTPNERIVFVDSPEYREWAEKQPPARGPQFVVSKIDREECNRTGVAGEWLRDERERQHSRNRAAIGWRSDRPADYRNGSADGVRLHGRGPPESPGHDGPLSAAEVYAESREIQRLYCVRYGEDVAMTRELERIWGLSE